jgi:glycolate oxidase iron-sulfur subunit
VEAGVEAIVITASGCGTMVREYGHQLARDPRYADKAARVSALSKDISEIVLAEHARLETLLLGTQSSARSPASGAKRRVAFHSPCTLQHGLKIRGAVEPLLVAAGFELTAVPDGHLCCGSAGTYSILQPELSQRLLRNKVDALASGQPEVVATANIGCLTHLQSGTAIPVRHWIDLLDERLP